MKAGEEVDEIDNDEIEGCDEAAEQEHRHDHDHGRICELLVTADALILRFPGPRRFFQRGPDFAEKISRFWAYAKKRMRGGGLGLKREETEAPVKTLSFI